MSSSNTVTLRGTPCIQEKAAAAAITPGMLIERTSADAFQAHSTSAGSAQNRFALENEYEGNGIDDAYASGEQVRAGVFKAGDEVNALLANGQTAVIGSLLISNGDGYLKLYVVADSGSDILQDKSIVGEAREALDLSDSSAADPASQRIRVELY